jgi:hypothetical protein
VLPQGVKNLLAALLEGRREEDVFPTRYRMNTEPRIRGLARSCGLEVEEIRLVDSTPSTVMLGPVVILELLWIRLLRHGPFRALKTDIVAVLRRADGRDGDPAR